jgi:hypothetical protein
MRKVKTSKRVNVEMGEKGASPILKVNTILLINAKGAYINPSLLEVL